MLHTKCCGNRPAGSSEEDFELFLPYAGIAAIYVERPASYKNVPKSLHKKMVKTDG